MKVTLFQKYESKFLVSKRARAQQLLKPGAEEDDHANGHEDDCDHGALLAPMTGAGPGAAAGNAHRAFPPEFDAARRVDATRAVSSV